jgi:hypothetical protein
MDTSYAEIFESFPAEFRVPMARLMGMLREELQVTKSDFSELRNIVQALAEAQRQTESELQDLKSVVQVLAEAQRQTESELQDLKSVVQVLVESQRQLSEAQKRSENRLDRLEHVVAELAEAQRQTDASVKKLAEEQQKFGRIFHSQMGALGSRWGRQTEGAFREGIRAILQEVGFVTRQFSDFDEEGKVFGRPEQVEIDAVIKNGKLILVEIKSAVDKYDVHIFANKAAFYSQSTGRSIDRKLIVVPFVEDNAKTVADRLNIEICTDVNTVS